MLRPVDSATVRLLDGFDDSVFRNRSWEQLLGQRATDSVFQTPWWQKSWWASFGRGQLLLFGVFRQDRLIGVAPLFADGGMIFFVGSGGSDYLDFIGEVPDYASVLAGAVESAKDFVGFRFYHVDDRSETGSQLCAAADRLGFDCHDEGDLAAPMMNLGSGGAAAISKKSLIRHQRFFEREGGLSVCHHVEASEILPRLETFFEQHVSRWAGTGSPSLFEDPQQRRFYTMLAGSNGPGLPLRFTQLSWNGRSIAFHFGFSYKGSFMWYKPSFEIALAKHSPGEVLLRELIVFAMREGRETFDFGLGNEAFKQRFATATHRVRTWGIYPRDTSGATEGV